MNSNRLSRITVSGFFIFIAVASGCDCGNNPAWEPTSYTIDIPAFFPPMDIPADNPMTEEGIKLGRLLFWEKSLSLDHSISCGSCHTPTSSFSDPNPFSSGVNGTLGSRNASVIVNLGWSSSFFWDGRAMTLEDQIRDPIEHPLEMNVAWEVVVDRLMNDDFNPDEWRLNSCNVKIFEGLIYINLSDNPVGFEDFISPTRKFIELHGLGDAKIAHRAIYPTDGNWKLTLDNFHECYHCGPAHPEYCSVHDKE
mgnify:CR=1 FL=1